MLARRMATPTRPVGNEGTDSINSRPLSEAQTIHPKKTCQSWCDNPKHKHLIAGRPMTSARPKHLTTAKVFMNGRSQAVRLPKEFRFSSDEVVIRREGTGLVLSPMNTSWDEFWGSGSGFTPDFIGGGARRRPAFRRKRGVRLMRCMLDTDICIAASNNVSGFHPQLPLR